MATMPVMELLPALLNAKSAAAPSLPELLVPPIDVTFPLIATLPPDIVIAPASPPL